MATPLTTHSGRVGSTSQTPAPLSRVPADVEKATDFDWVPLDEIFADMRYARPLNVRRIERMAAEFDPRAVGVLLLSLRPDGKYAAIDGNHRHASAVVARSKYGRTDVARLPARIYIDLTLEDEAALYRRFADVHKQRPFDLFKARLAQGDRITLNIMAILHSFGLNVSDSSSDQNTIGAVSSVLESYEQLGPDGFRDIIGILHEAWGGDPRAYSNMALLGMTLFWKRYRTMVDRTRLVDRLRHTSPLEMLGKVNGFRQFNHRYTGPGTWGMMLHKEYNVGLRNHKLPEWEERALTTEARSSLASRMTEQNHARKGTPEAREVARRSVATKRAGRA